MDKKSQRFPGLFRFGDSSLAFRSRCTDRSTATPGSPLSPKREDCVSVSDEPPRSWNEKEQKEKKDEESKGGDDHKSLPEPLVLPPSRRKKSRKVKRRPVYGMPLDWLDDEKEEAEGEQEDTKKDSQGKEDGDKEKARREKKGKNSTPSVLVQGSDKEEKEIERTSADPIRGGSIRKAEKTGSRLNLSLSPRLGASSASSSLAPATSAITPVAISSLTGEKRKESEADGSAASPRIRSSRKTQSIRKEGERGEGRQRAGIRDTPRSNSSLLSQSLFTSSSFQDSALGSSSLYRHGGESLPLGREFFPSASSPDVRQAVELQVLQKTVR